MSKQTSWNPIALSVVFDMESLGANGKKRERGEGRGRRKGKVRE